MTEHSCTGDDEQDIIHASWNPPQQSGILGKSRGRLRSWWLQPPTACSYHSGINGNSWRIESRFYGKKMENPPPDGAKWDVC